MKINNESQSCHGYFRSGNEVNFPYYEPIGSIYLRKMTENMLANGLVIYLIVPYLNISKNASKNTSLSNKFSYILSL